MFEMLKNVKYFISDRNRITLEDRITLPPFTQLYGFNMVMH